MIRIVTDSASDITQAEAKELGIDVLPLVTRFGMEEFKDGIDITFTEFFDKLETSEELPTTSLVSPAAYDDCFKKYPNDDVICIVMSSKLSGCCQSAILAASENPNVKVVDSLNVTAGERLLVVYALQLIEKGLSADEIVDLLNEKKSKIRLMAVLDTLKYLQKSGRISGVTAAFGTLLSIKPLVHVVDGELRVLAKGKGVKGARKQLMTEIENVGEIDDTMPRCIAFSGKEDSLLQEYIAEKPEVKDLPVVTIGAVVGTHAGPGAYGEMFFIK